MDKQPFPVNTIDLENAKVLVQPEQEKSTKGKNVIIGEKRTINADDKILSREVVMEKKPDGKTLFKDQDYLFWTWGARCKQIKYRRCCPGKTELTGFLNQQFWFCLEKPENAKIEKSRGWVSMNSC